MFVVANNVSYGRGTQTIVDRGVIEHDTKAIFIKPARNGTKKDREC